MVNFSTIPTKIVSMLQKEPLYELACECTSDFFSELRANEIIEEMYKCKNCKKPVFLIPQKD